jgi:uncharacterized protein
MKCDFCKISVLVFLIVALGFFAAYQFVPPAPPKEFRIATGSTSGAYYAFANEYQKTIDKQGLKVEVQPTAGSIETLTLLKNGKVDLGFVQGGTAKNMPTEGLHSLGSLFYEPLWVFHRNTVTVQYLSDLKGKKIAIGAEGSGTRPLALQLLQDNGMDANNTTFLGLSSADAKKQLESGEIDAAFLVVSPKAAMVSDLLSNPELTLMSFKRALAYTSRYHFLSTVTIGEGAIDLQKNIPAQDKTLLAVTASLVAREHIHPDLVRLVLKEAILIHSPSGMLEKKNQFPSEEFLEIPIHKEAQQYLRQGPSWLENILPFWLASMIDRLKVMLIPLVMLMLPLLKSIPPIYQWRVRSQIYRWYETLREVDGQLESFDIEIIDKEIIRLQILQGELAKQTVIPLSYTAEFYQLRTHINFILGRLQQRHHALTQQHTEIS